MAIKTGSIVQLKSGGPEMTVIRIIGESKEVGTSMIDEALTMSGYTNGDVLCCWFTKEKKYEERVFKLATLEEFEEDE